MALGRGQYSIFLCGNLGHLPCLGSNQAQHLAGRRMRTNLTAFVGVCAANIRGKRSNLGIRRQKQISPGTKGADTIDSIGFLFIVESYPIHRAPK